MGNNAECSTFDRKLTYARMQEAITRDGLTPDGWVFMVLTLDVEGTYSGKKRWLDVNEAFRDLSQMTRDFFTRLRRWAPSEKLAKRERRQVMKKPGREWVATVEVHKSGWPHVNLVMWAPELAEYIERERERMGDEYKRLGFPAETLAPELMRMAKASGWGTRSTAERVRSQDKVLNYISKLSIQADRVFSEIAKLTQLPRNAPQRMRRLRSGKGFLPPRRKDADHFGTLIRRLWDHDGTPQVLPVHNVKDPLLVEVMPLLCYAEDELWAKERENRAQLLAELAKFHAAGSMLTVRQATDGLMASLAKARRAELEQIYAKFGTPLSLTVDLPLRPVSITGPPATAPPAAANDCQSELFDP